MSFDFWEASSVRHLQNSVDILGQYLSLSGTVLAWGTTHPFWAVAIAISFLVILQTLLELAVQVVRQALLRLVRLPLTLIRSGVNYGWQVSRQASQSSDIPNVEAQIAAIFERLDQLRQEQDTLMKTLALLLTRQ